MATTDTHDDVSAPAETNEVGPEETKEQITERAMRQSEPGVPCCTVERIYASYIGVLVATASTDLWTLLTARKKMKGHMFTDSSVYFSRILSL
jgi:hypothetical protein